MIGGQILSAARSDGICAGRNPEALERIEAPGVSVAVWNRRPLRSFQEWIDSLPVDRLPEMRAVTTPDLVETLVEAACSIARTPECVERERLIGDVAALADILHSVTRAPYVRVRMERVSDNACKKFHQDYVTARLICTYRGTGTQYGESRDGGEPSQVRMLPTGVPAIFRGRLWPARQGAPVLHRSPPISGTGEVRSLLVLDPITDSEVGPEDSLVIAQGCH